VGCCGTSKKKERKDFEKKGSNEEGRVPPEKLRGVLAHPKDGGHGLFKSANEVRKKARNSKTKKKEGRRKENGGDRGRNRKIQLQINPEGPERGEKGR